MASERTVAIDEMGQRVVLTNEARVRRDEELVSRIKAGDDSAFGTLVSIYFPIAVGMVRKFVPPDDAEDVTQEIFLGLIVYIRSFQGKSSFATWFHRIVTNKVADYHRKVACQGKRERLGRSTVASHYDSSALEELEVQEVLGKLPRKYKAILLLKFNEGMNFSEIAEKLDITYEASRSRYRRAKEAFREEFDKI